MLTSAKQKNVTKLLFGLVALKLAVDVDKTSLPLYRTLRGSSNTFPISINTERQRLRHLSLDLGNGRCKWQPPKYIVPEAIDFHKTAIVGFPSGDKRMIFIQMEALTGWPAKDEWDFKYRGMSNHPFIKANYPHHEGIWGWDDAADQVVMMIRNIRRTMVEYHDILWDIGYAKTWEDASKAIDDLYGERPPIEDFLAWRDLRVLDETHWYGWFIDYWMEGGLMRDMFTNKITTPEHWNMLMMPTVYTKAEMDYDLIVGNTVVTPSYDPHCTNGDISGGCQPVAIISAEKLRDYTDGPAETALIASVLNNDNRTGQYVIAQNAWDCIWEELIENGKGLKTVADRPGFNEQDYNFSAEMLEGMLFELDRLIDKYSSPEWNATATSNTITNANRVVELLVEHRNLIRIELNEVNSGVRKLADKDFLGPIERARRRKLKFEEDGMTDSENDPRTQEHFQYFNAVHQKLVEKKRGITRSHANKSR